MAIFESEVRSATVRALGDVKLLTVDKKNFLRRIHEDPSLAYHIVQTLSHRILCWIHSIPALQPVTAAIGIRVPMIYDSGHSQ